MWHLLSPPSSSLHLFLSDSSQTTCAALSIYFSLGFKPNNDSQAAEPLPPSSDHPLIPFSTTAKRMQHSKPPLLFQTKTGCEAAGSSTAAPA
ncbi:hypothetical protein SORBI_3009G192450 [Sorghum bicolor]|uniref:Uncharacterized protein n=1 Tax=Sorghum bicolor TaxID=4558 RepID=A0A1Z5R3F9_SORBI|nr:hypothetical protein SORBI_3009G192450 [Sorghum bicolor]